MEKRSVSRFTRGDFGGRAIELSGRAVHPNTQGRGIGTDMLAAFLMEHPTEYLATYTRNPAILRMMGSVATSLYPFDDSPELGQIASQMANATPHGNATYHLDRYAPGGLFQGGDPALSTIATAPYTLRQRFPILENERHALVITAKVKGDFK